MERDGVLTSDVKEGYVMKNDPFRKQMLVSPVIVPIEEGKFFGDQLDGIDLTTISYFQLRPGKHEEPYKKKKWRFEKKQKMIQTTKTIATSERKCLLERNRK